MSDEYVYFDSPDLSFIQYGKEEMYNQSRIYGTYYHSETYTPVKQYNKTSPLLRVC